MYFPLIECEKTCIQVPVIKHSVIEIYIRLCHHVPTLVRNQYDFLFTTFTLYTKCGIVMATCFYQLHALCVASWF